MRRSNLVFLAPVGMSIAMGGVLSVCGALIAIQRIGMNPFELGVLGCVGGPFYMLVSYLAGRFSDASHPRRLVLAGTFGSLAICVGYFFVSAKWHLYTLAVFSGVFNGSFWAPFQAWLRREREGEAARCASYYNISWGGGETIGVLLGGALYQAAWWLGVIGAIGGCSLACAVVLAFKPGSLGQETPDPESEAAAGESHLASGAQRQDNPSRRELLLAWAGCFAVVYANGSIGSQFPKLGTELAFSPSVIAAVLFAMRLARLAYFAASAWAASLLEKPHAGTVLTLGGVAGMLLVAASSSPLLLALGTGLFGVFMGLRMHRAVAVCMSAPRGAGRLVGINEIVVMVGFLTGSFFGGLLAQHAGLRWPYLGAAILFSFLIAAEFALEKIRR